jgi:hypothetical protein
MRSLENRVRANLKCHFGGLAIAIPEPETVTAGKLASPGDPKAADYNFEAARKASYETRAELTYNRYGTVTTNPSGTQQPAITDKMAEALTKARQKIFDTLKASPETAEVSDLYSDNRYKGLAESGAFAPIFFVYVPPARIPPRQEAVKTSARRYYFVYNGRFLIVAALCEPGMEVPALQEIVSEACLLMSKSGYEFRQLSPIPTLQSLDLRGTSAASSPMGAVFNDSIGRAGTATSLLVTVPRNVQESLRSLYATSFQYMMAFYSLKEESDTREVLFQTVEAQREAVLGLMHEFNQTRERQFLRRRKLRKLIRTHCLSLTEKIGRVDALSDSLAQGIISLDSDLQQEQEIRGMLEREPGWRSYLHNSFDTKPVLEMVARTNEEIGGHDIGLVVFLIVLLAAAAGAVAGSLISRML